MNFQNIANLIEKKKFHEAKACLIELEKKNLIIGKKSSHLEKNYENIYFSLSQVCVQLNELKNSIKYLIKHLSFYSKDVDALLNLANLYLKTHKIGDAEKIYKDILEIDKNYLPAIVNLAFLYEGVGNINDSIKYYKIAKKNNPNDLYYYYNLIRFNLKYLNEKEIEFIEKLYESKKIEKKKEYLVNFILSKKFEKKKDYSNEMKFLDLSHKNFLENNVNEISLKYWLDIIPHYHDKLICKNSKKKMFKDMSPIFIIGLPRSGSTITELILSTSKTSKFVLGETSLISQILMNNYSSELFSNPRKKKIEIQLDLIEDKILAYLNNFEITSSEKSIIIDKSLENFFYIDLIIQIFPKAKFIITERNIDDNVIGIYKKILMNIPWGHSINNINQYIKNYKNITDFYKKKYKENIFCINLTDLQNLNNQKVSKLFDFCNLNFNEKYYDFQNKYQFVNNASNIQIRSKLSKVENNKYEKYLGLLDNR